MLQIDIEKIVKLFGQDEKPIVQSHSWAGTTPLQKPPESGHYIAALPQQAV